MSKKAQVQQLFFYIFAIIVTAVVLFLGIKSIFFVTETASDVTIANFVTDVTNDINKNFNLGMNSRTSDNLMIPVSTDLICFIDPESIIDFSVIKDPQLKIKISGLAKVKKDNLYLNIGKDLRSYEIKNMKPKNNIQCKQGNMNDINLILENKGKYTEVQIQ